MRGGKNKIGYTITEVLIVLAISSAMFLTANAFISGRVAENTFRNGVNEMASRIQDAIDQVASGQFSDRPIKCSTSGTSININTSDSTSSQGSNAECVFAGKLFKFTANSKQYTLDTYAASRVSENNTSFTNLQKIDDFSATSNIPGGLSVSPIGDSSSVGDFGFSLNPSTAASGSPDKSNVWLVVDSNFTRARGSRTICLTDGKRSAKIIVGDDSSNMSVKTDFLISSC